MCIITYTIPIIYHRLKYLVFIVMVCGCRHSIIAILECDIEKCIDVGCDEDLARPYYTIVSGGLQLHKQSPLFIDDSYHESEVSINIKSRSEKGKNIYMV